VAGDGRRLVGALSSVTSVSFYAGIFRQTVVPETYGRVGDRVIVASGRQPNSRFAFSADAGAPC